MKKIILLSFVSATILVADITTIIPYSGVLSYSEDIDKTDKESSSFVGIYASHGDLNYLVEVGYTHLTSIYKDSSYEILNQDNIAIAYSQYYKNFMFKLGTHYIGTNDTILGDGTLFIASFGGYNWSGYDKYSYGLESYYSLYNNGHNEIGIEKPINILQFTPYFSFYKSFHKNIQNSITLKVNFEITKEYLQKTYISYELSDTIYYKSFFTTLKLYGGEMKTGVKDGGMSVYNSLDLLESGYSIALGYYLDTNVVLNATYGENSYIEYGKTQEQTNSVISASLKYSF